jgi:hypothetical protein
LAGGNSQPYPSTANLAAGPTQVANEGLEHTRKRSVGHPRALLDSGILAITLGNCSQHTERLNSVVALMICCEHGVWFDVQPGTWVRDMRCDVLFDRKLGIEERQIERHTAEDSVCSECVDRIPKAKQIGGGSEIERAHRKPASNAASQGRIARKVTDV